jgi:GAF domain-containing protein/HAMP domain-containing protein
MSDKDLRNQLEGLFSDIVPKLETEKGKAIIGPLEAEPAEAELIVPETPPVAGMEPEQIAEETPLSTAEEREAPSTLVSMAKPAPRLTVRQSIRTRLLALLLGLTILSVLTVAYLGVNSIQRAGRSAQQISSEALRAQAEEYLCQLTTGDAQRNDLTLKKVQHDAENVAQYAASIFEKPDTFARFARGSYYWRAEDHMFMGPEGQYINDKDDICSVFVPNFVDINDELLTALESGAYLDFIFPTIYESDPNTVAIYLGTKQETTRYYPNINLGTILTPDFKVTQRPWYTNSTLENNPERRAIWSPVYEDATGKGLMVTAAAPIYTSRDEFVGVVGIDVTLKDISANVEEARLLGSGYSFLVDDTGHAIALPEQGYQDILGRAPGPNELGTDLSTEVTTEFAPVLAQMITGSTGFEILEGGRKELFVAYAPLESTGWSLASVVEAEEVLQAVSALREELRTSTTSLVLTRILPIGGAVLVIVAVLGVLLANRLIDPIQRLAAAAQQIGVGQWDIPLPRTGHDEIGVLSQAFATMTGQLRQLLEGLEQRVAERTRELDRLVVQLATAAEVSHAATSVLDPDELMRQTVDLIRARFGFYYVGLFLLDEAKRWAVLRAGTGEPGRQMLKAGHRLQVGGESMVGWCTANAQARIALDIGEEAVHFDNPLLPETRSEMALPLISRGEIIGALTVQSAEVAAFSDEDISVLQTMADQLAVAMDNARLFREVQSSLEEVQTIHRHYLQEAWEGFTSLPEARLGYRYAGPGPTSSEEAWVPAMTKAVQQVDAVTAADGEGAELAVPITLRGQTIGVLGLRRDETGGWTADDVAVVQAVAEQVALTLENMRLFEETRRRAQREQVIREITTKMRGSTDLDTILQTTIQELAKVLGTSRTFVQLSTSSESVGDEGENRIQPLAEGE